jgi:hypothetical protein
VTSYVVDFPRLAELIAERVRPQLPDGLVVEIAEAEYLEALSRRRANLPAPFAHIFSMSPDDGVLRAWNPPDPAGRIIRMRHDGSPTATADAISGSVSEALSGIADEASELSTDHFDGDARVDGDRLRLWFGRVEPGVVGVDWRERLPELPAIDLAQIAS